MRLGNLTIALLAMLFAIACVPPQGKGPKKSADAKYSAPTDTKDDQLDPVDTPTNNDTPSNNVPDPTLTCGDGVVDDGEACDGDTAVTCEELGFDGGFTVCSTTCSIDTSACVRLTCGDGVVQEDEVCDDGAQNGGYDACNGNCSGLDQYCGDGVLNGPEACDGTAFAGATCASFGFDGGTMRCTSACSVDTSSCTSCGDGVVQGNEVCDDGSANGTYGHCNTQCTGVGASCGDGVRNGSEQCDGTQVGSASCETLGEGRGSLGCTASCTFDVSTCSLAPAPGDVIISEIMQNPAVSLDNDGEFFEVYNTRGLDLDLGGCDVISSTATGSESFTVSGSVFVPAGGYAVFARSSNAPFAADYVYNGQLNLNNSTDDLAIVCPQPDGSTAEIDRVAYDDGFSFPDPEGASMVLDPRRLTGVQNDSGSNWCASTSMFGVGDYGTPGYANDFCF